MDIGEIVQDSEDDVIFGVMYLQNVLKIQKVESSQDLDRKKTHRFYWTINYVTE